MGSEKESSNKNYRLPMTFINALFMGIPYLAILLVMQKASGVTLTEIGDSAENVRDFITIPVGVATLYLITVGYLTGWIKDVWHDKKPLEKPQWLKWFLYIMVTIIAVNFLTGNILTNDPGIIIYALFGTMFVGFTEEIMLRGYLLQGARNSGFTEKKVAATTSLFFGLIHGVNILSGESVAAVIPQIVNAFMLGMVLYFIFRYKASLLLLMVIHFLYDFAIFTRGEISETDPRAIFSLTPFLLTFVSLILIIKTWKYLDTAKTASK